jgi:hypothetical protein
MMARKLALAAALTLGNRLAGAGVALAGLGLGMSEWALAQLRRATI